MTPADAVALIALLDQAEADARANGWPAAIRARFADASTVAHAATERFTPTPVTTVRGS